MSKLQCPCGEIINVTNHINEFELVPNEWIEGIMEKIEENALMSEDCIFQSFLAVHQTVYKCPNCFRLWLENSNGAYDSYIPEHKCEGFLGNHKKS